MVGSEAFYFLGVGVLLTIALLLYFKLALTHNIVDKPNQRSSHHQPVIRGGGIIFVLAVVGWFFTHDFQWHWFVLGTVCIAMISFLDDVVSVNPLVRFLFQLVGLLCIVVQLWPITWPVYLLALAVIVCIGTINAFNFMDGINGITGIYGLVCLLTFAFLQWQVILFTDLSLIATAAIAVVIFLFFNFRKRAVCFAGDVGSVTISYILIFLLIQLILVTHNFLWPILFLVYGVDAIVTIAYRLKNCENIFKPHRSHLYQYLVNEFGWQHRTVSLQYGLAQALVNIMVIPFLLKDELLEPILVALVFVVCYFLFRIFIVKRITGRNLLS